MPSGISSATAIHTLRIACCLQVLSGIINATDVPFTSYTAFPRTPLHFVDARIKQLWLVALLVLIPRLPWQARISVVGAILLLTVVCLPWRLARGQLSRLLPLGLLLATVTALTADQVRAPGSVRSIECKWCARIGERASLAAEGYDHKTPIHTPSQVFEHRFNHRPRSGHPPETNVSAIKCRRCKR